jgi:hypothetical protein
MDWRRLALLPPNQIARFPNLCEHRSNTSTLKVFLAQGRTPRIMARLKRKETAMALPKLERAIQLKPKKRKSSGNNQRIRDSRTTQIIPNDN